MILPNKPDQKYNSGLLGWRKWYTNSRGELLPLTSDQAWNRGENKAICLKHEDHEGRQQIPNSECSCGMYAYYQPNREFKFDLRQDGCVFSRSILGLVMGYGRVELHPGGFRSEKMLILGVVDNGSLATSQIIENYKIDSFDALDELMSYATYLSQHHSLEIIDKGIPIDAEYYSESGDRALEATRDSRGSLHSIDDRPAITYLNKSEWRHHGLLHRNDDLPAIVRTNEQEWWNTGRLYRENDKPAKIVRRKHGEIHFWYNDEGFVHRDNKPAQISVADPGYYWHRNDFFPITYTTPEGVWISYNHKTVGSDTNVNLQVWKQNGLIHREDGPALVIPGEKSEFWQNGIPCEREGQNIPSHRHLALQLPLNKI